MKKTLLATSLLAAFGAASAQVTIGGLIDGGYSVETHNNVSQTIYNTNGTLAQAGGAASNYNGGNINATQSRVANNAASRLFFAGSETIGGGLKANFRLETQIDIGNGTGNSGINFNRGAWFGLSNNAGSFQLGRQGTASIGLICGTVDHNACLTGFYGGGVLFTGAGVGTTNNGAYIFAANPKYHGTGYRGVAQANSTYDSGTAIAGGTMGQDATRYTRAVVVETAAFSGFKARVDVATDNNSDVATNVNNPAVNGGAAPKKETTMSLGLSYANGPWSAGAVTATAKMGSLNRVVTGNILTAVPVVAGVAIPGQSATLNTGVYNASGNTTPASAANSIANPVGTANEKATINTVGLRYKAGAISIGGGLQAGKSSDNLGTAGSHKSMTVNGTYTFGSIRPFVSYQTMKAKDGAGNAAYNSKVVNVGVNYLFSPRTTGYIDYAKETGLVNANTPQNGFASVVDQNVKGKFISVGMRHAF